MKFVKCINSNNYNGSPLVDNKIYKVKSETEDWYRLVNVFGGWSKSRFKLLGEDFNIRIANILYGGTDAKEI